MTPEQRAKAYSERQKVKDWQGDPIAEAWLEGFRSQATHYILEATVEGMEKKLEELEKWLETQHEHMNGIETCFACTVLDFIKKGKK